MISDILLASSSLRIWWPRTKIAVSSSHPLNLDSAWKSILINPWQPHDEGHLAGILIILDLMAKDKDGFFIEPSAKLGLCLKVIFCLDGGDEGHLAGILIIQDLVAKDKYGLFIALMALRINWFEFSHFEWLSRYRDGARAGHPNPSPPPTHPPTCPHAIPNCLTSKH